MFVMSYVLPPANGATFGKAEVCEMVSEKQQAADVAGNLLILRDVPTLAARRFCNDNLAHADTGTDVKHAATGITFRIDHVDRAPNACPCCGRLVKWPDNPFAGSDDAYCDGCYTWDRNTPQCLPENSCHTWAEIHYEVDGETVKGGEEGETWYATYRVPDIYADKNTTEDVAETYGAPRYERKEN